MKLRVILRFHVQNPLVVSACKKLIKSFTLNSNVHASCFAAESLSI